MKSNRKPNDGEEGGEGREGRGRREGKGLREKEERRRDFVEVGGGVLVDGERGGMEECGVVERTGGRVRKRRGEEGREGLRGEEEGIGMILR